MNKADDPKVAAAIAEGRRQNEEAVERHPVVSEEEWLKQRLALMEKEKQIHAGRRCAGGGSARTAVGEGGEDLHIHNLRRET